MVVRTLTFQQISDSRFNGSEFELGKLTSGVESALSVLPEVKFQIEELRYLDSSETSTKSWRQRFNVQKVGRKTTWNDVYKAVNSVKAVPYDFVSMSSFFE